MKLKIQIYTVLIKHKLLTKNAETASQSGIIRSITNEACKLPYLNCK